MFSPCLDGQGREVKAVRLVFEDDTISGGEDVPLGEVLDYFFAGESL